MNRFSRYIAAALVAASAFPASAYDFFEGNIYYKFNPEDADPPSVAVTYGESSNGTYSGRVDIPTTVTHAGVEYDVTAIDRSAFLNCRKLTEVSIPPSITSIGYQAFYNCTALKVVNITDLQRWADISFNDALANPLYYAVRLMLNGRQVTDVTLSSARPYCFYNYTRLRSVDFYPEVSYIGTSAFEGCRNLETVNIPATVKRVAIRSFSRCDALRRLVIADAPDSLYFDTQMEESLAPDHLYIGRDIVIPTYKYSGYDITYQNPVFDSYAVADTLEIGPQVRSFSYYLLRGKANRLIMSPQIKSMIGSFPQSNVLEISDLEAWLNIDWSTPSSNPMSNAASLCIDGQIVEDLVVPASVTALKVSAITATCGLQSITFAGKVTTVASNSLPRVPVYNLGTSTFDPKALSLRCDRITASPDNELYTTIDGVLYDKSGTRLLYCPPGRSGLFIVPEGVESIASGAFSNYYASDSPITGIVLPSTLTAIDDYAFNSSSDYNKIACVYNLSSLPIERRKYSNFGNVAYYAQAVTDNIQWSGDLVFARFDDGEYYLTAYTGNASQLTLPSTYRGNAYHLGPYAFAGAPSVKKVVLPTTMTDIGAYAFNSSAVEEVLIPSSVTSIGYKALESTKIRSLHLPASVTTFSTNNLQYNINEIVMDSPEPPTLAYNTFYNASSSFSYLNPTVYVPDEAAATLYRAANEWKKCNIEVLPEVATISFSAIYSSDPPMATITRRMGEALGELPTPTRPGYTFTGWSILNRQGYSQGLTATPDTPVQWHKVQMVGQWTLNPPIVQQPTSENPTTIYNPTRTNHFWYYKHGEQIPGQRSETLDVSVLNGESDVYCLAVTNDDYSDYHTYRTRTVTVTPPTADHWRADTDGLAVSTPAYAVFTFNGSEPTYPGRFQLAAFRGDRCIAVADYTAVLDNQYWLLNVHTDSPSWSDVELRLYDAFSGREYRPVDGATLSSPVALLSSPDYPVSLVFADVYTIRCTVDGEPYTSYPAYVGQTLTLPAPLTRTGYKFTGWTGMPAIMPAADVEISGGFIPYTLREETLEAGWHWLSMNSDEPLGADIFGSDLVMALSREASLVNDPVYGYLGDLHQFRADAMYKVKLSQPSTFALDCNAKPYNYPQPLQPRWNWIGAFLPYATDINAALAGNAFTDGDVISSQEAFAEYYSGRWVGTLTTLAPGRGYMLRCSEEGTLVFNEPEPLISEATAPQAAPGRNDLPQVDIHRFPDVMHIVGRLYINSMEQTDECYTVAAYCGSDCRGIGSVINNRLFLTIHGAEAEELTLVAIHSDGRRFQCTEPLHFTSAVEGSIDMPLDIQMTETTGIDTPATLDSDADSPAAYDLLGRPASPRAAGFVISPDSKRLNSTAR